jgi:hypothetical protein
VARLGTKQHLYDVLPARGTAVYGGPANAHDAHFTQNQQASEQVCDLQSDAMATGREIARNQLFELRIQGCDGNFREAGNYGNDPFPPRSRIV